MHMTEKQKDMLKAQLTVTTLGETVMVSVETAHPEYLEPTSDGWELMRDALENAGADTTSMMAVAMPHAGETREGDPVLVSCLVTASAPLRSALGEMCAPMPRKPELCWP